jgi:hypothetical protein
VKLDKHYMVVLNQHAFGSTMLPSSLLNSCKARWTQLEDGHTTIIIIDVDDFLRSSLKVSKRDKSISVTYGPVIECLSLNFSTPNQVTITMKNKIETILDSYSIASSVISPAADQIECMRRELWPRVPW